MMNKRTSVLTELRELFDDVVCFHQSRGVPSNATAAAFIPKVRNPTCSQTDGFVIFLVVFCESSRGGVAAMKRNLARRVVIFGSMLTAAVTVAQAAAANPLTVSEALKNNPELRGLAADVEATMLKLNNVILSSNSF
jgi:hypothetical protein